MNKLLFIFITTLILITPLHAQDNSLSFFVTSNGLGKGGDLGGLAGADAHCKKLAESVGAGDREWRAYLSTQGPNAVNARDRIGDGPWYNASGAMIAAKMRKNRP